MNTAAIFWIVLSLLIGAGWGLLILYASGWWWLAAVGFVVTCGVCVLIGAMLITGDEQHDEA